MKPAPFEYFAPESLSSVLSILAGHGDDAKLLAGGQSLIPAMNFRLIQPSILVDLNRLGELDYIDVEANGGIRIGAMTRQRRIERDFLIAERIPLLHEAMPHIAHFQIRNRGTIGGSLAHADPAAELPVIMVALDSRFKLRSESDERWIRAEDFFHGLFTTALRPEEVLIEIMIPPMSLRTGWAFVEFARRKGDYALLGLAALLTLDEDGKCHQARIVYLNAGDMPTNAQGAANIFINEKPSEAVFEAAAEVAISEISPTADIHASVDYLRHLARTLSMRAFRTAAERAEFSSSH